jgi:predicted dithiol-disulfide oxidoreductase (DUF899 family)
MPLPEIVSADEWRAARAALLEKEKAHTRARDALAAERRRLPAVEVTKDYVFTGPDGQKSLLDLFEGRRQLLVYRFFFEPDVAGWPDKGCPGCSMFADNVPNLVHLRARDTSFAFVSGGGSPEIERMKRRFGWEAFPWYSTQDDFSADFDVPEYFGLNVFLREGDRIFRTNFVTGRGAEDLASIWGLLDVTPYGRQEAWEDSPEGWPQTPPYQWWRRNDEYDEAPGPA